MDWGNLGSLVSCGKDVQQEGEPYEFIGIFSCNKAGLQLLKKTHGQLINEPGWEQESIFWKSSKPYLMQAMTSMPCPSAKDDEIRDLVDYKTACFLKADWAGIDEECGIAGIVNFGGAEPDRSVLGRMTDIMQPRGPDDSGYFVGKGVGFGFRRLSIIDLTSGNQPITNEDGSVVLIQNGEIYNFKELRGELEGKAYLQKPE